MEQPDFWTKSAQAVELGMEGNRLIANEIAEQAQSVWRRLAHAVFVMLHAEHRHLPPV